MAEAEIEAEPARAVLVANKAAYDAKEPQRAARKLATKLALEALKK